MNKIRIPHNKGTENSETVDIPLPEKVVIPLSQHMGAPCEALVKAGDHVKVGEKIGDTDAFMSAPIHSSVSGTVKELIEYLPANGRPCRAVVIETDGLQEVSEQVSPPRVNDRESFIKAVRDSGCCGLGGAGFPTHIKLAFDPEKTPVDSLIVNGAECEPYITSDYRELIENTGGVFNGIKTIQKYLGIEKAYVCIEDNKPKAIKMLEEEAAKDDTVSVVKLRSAYPQGAEKVAVYSATKRIIGEGELPSDKGVLVMNVSTVSFIDGYLKNGMPMVSRRITVDGDVVRTPCNMRVPLGTPVSKLLEFADCKPEAADKILAGGPMMGLCLFDTETPICKTNNAILAFRKAKEPVRTNCIRCGRCVRACPLDLMPQSIEKAYDARDIETLKKLKVGLCMNCGSCSYVCPAKRDLAEKNQLAKELIR